MDPRRVNDALKILGTMTATLAALAPFVAAAAQIVPPQYAALVTALGAFLAGLGTRGAGLEYRDVAEAKVKASMVPPPPTGAAIAPQEDTD